MYDLENRTEKFSKNIISLINSINKDLVNRRILDQLIRSATSIGANYREANETETRKDFKYRIRIAKKEAKETIYWLKLLQYNNEGKDKIKELLRESKELTKILGSIFRKLT